MDIVGIVQDLVVILLAGTLANAACKRLGISLLVGYLVVGSLIGPGGMAWVMDPGHELEMIAEAGALLLLFSVGIAFSIDELVGLRRYFLIGGALQMAFVAAPLTLASHWAGIALPGAVLAGAAGAFSSTVLVFRALTEQGHSESAHGRGGLAVLLFQDAALVPCLMLIPLMSGEGPPAAAEYGWLAAKALGFVVAVWALNHLLIRLQTHVLAPLRSVELVTLLAVTLLTGLGWIASRLDLPPAIGAFAAGLALSGGRLTKQIDTIILPFRETFAAIFFVTLGMLLRPAVFLDEPLVLSAGLVAMLTLKSVGAATALRIVGLPWRAALGMGVGLSQLGEFSFLLAARGMNAGLIDPVHYNRMLFIAIATLVLTPWLLRHGLRLAGQAPRSTIPPPSGQSVDQMRAVVIGIGPIGGQVASRLETIGVDTALIDLSPMNLHPFAQEGFSTFAGDAREAEVLALAQVHERGLAVVCVPKDDLALEIVRALRDANPRLNIIVRCRYQSFARRLAKAGAAAVVSEEQEAAGPLMRQCTDWIETHRGGDSTESP